jgi:4-methyl-5(b-hydroxyethyl)-thiazole monophosphate biosynthesis
MKKVAVMLADGFEDVEALATVDILRRAGMTVDMVSIKGEYVESAHNVIVKADKLIDESLENYDMIVCPGGLPGAEYLSKCELLINTIKK